MDWRAAAAPPCGRTRGRSPRRSPGRGAPSAPIARPGRVHREAEDQPYRCGPRACGKLGTHAATRSRSTVPDQHLVDEAVGLGLGGGHEVVALGVALDPVDRLTRVLRVDGVDGVARLEDLA